MNDAGEDEYKRGISYEDLEVHSFIHHCCRKDAAYLQEPSTLTVAIKLQILLFLSTQLHPAF